MTTSPNPIDRTAIKAWQTCPEHIVAAETWDEAMTYTIRDLGVDFDDTNVEPEEVAMDYQFIDGDCDSDPRMTVAEAIASAHHFPCLICSTEY